MNADIEYTNSLHLKVIWQSVGMESWYGEVE